MKPWVCFDNTSMCGKKRVVFSLLLLRREMSVFRVLAFVGCIGRIEFIFDLRLQMRFESTIVP